MEYFNQDKKMSDIDKSYPFHSLIVPEDHVVYYLKSLSRSVTQACKLEKRRAAVFHVYAIAVESGTGTVHSILGSCVLRNISNCSHM